VVSPDGRTLAVLHSTANHPPELYFQDARAGAVARKITESPPAEFNSFGWIVPEIVMIPADDGTQIPARLYRPRGAAPNGAAVIFVHGAGYLQNVHRWWSSYYREYMFHHLLAARGYAVLDIDYRGSAGWAGCGGRRFTAIWADSISTTSSPASAGSFGTSAWTRAE
jgi:dipeptidyl aminopeptidase/acylaminoacyl peptidase